MSDNQQQICDVLAKVGQASMKEIRAAVGGAMNYNTLRGAARKLRDKGLIILVDGVYSLAKPKEGAPAVSKARKKAVASARASTSTAAIAPATYTIIALWVDDSGLKRDAWRVRNVSELYGFLRWTGDKTNARGVTLTIPGCDQVIVPMERVGERVRVSHAAADKAWRALMRPQAGATPDLPWRAPPQQLTLHLVAAA